MTAGRAITAVAHYPTQIRELEACESMSLFQESMKVNPVA